MSHRIRLGDRCEKIIELATPEQKESALRVTLMWLMTMMAQAHDGAGPAMAVTCALAELDGRDSDEFILGHMTAIEMLQKGKDYSEALAARLSTQMGAK